MSSAARTFLQTFDEHSSLEVSIVEGRRSTSPAPRRITTGQSFMGQVRTAIGSILRIIAKTLYFVPGLLVLKLIIGAVDVHTSDWIVVVFVSWVVLFFIVLNLYILATLFWWPFRNRGSLTWSVQKKPTLPAASLDPKVVGRGISVRGKIRYLFPESTFAVSAFQSEGAPFRRVVAVNPFVIMGEGPPVVVRCEKAPDVLGAGDGEGTAMMVAADPSALDPDQRGTTWSFVEGNEVEVIGTVERIIENADQFEIEGRSVSLAQPDASDEGPYRRAPGGPALLVSDAYARYRVLIARNG